MYLTWDQYDRCILLEASKEREIFHLINPCKSLKVECQSVGWFFSCDWKIKWLKFLHKALSMSRFINPLRKALPWSFDPNLFRYHKDRLPVSSPGNNWSIPSCFSLGQKTYFALCPAYLECMLFISYHFTLCDPSRNMDFKWRKKAS